MNNVELVTKYVDGLPYSSSYMAPDNDTLFFLKNTENGKKLHRLNLKQSTLLATGKQISDVDFSLRSFIPIDYDAKSEKIFVISDDENTENFNIYYINSIGPTAGQLHQLTHSACCLQVGFFSDYSKLLYVDRYRVEAGRFSSRLILKDLISSNERILFDDQSWTYRLSWGRIAVSSDMNYAVLTVDHENRRQALNLILVDLNDGSTKTLLPETEESANIYCEQIGFDDSCFFYCSDWTGFDTLYQFDLVHCRSTEILAPKNRSRGIGIRKDNNRYVAIAVVPIDENDQSEIIVGDLSKQIEHIKYILNGSYKLGESEQGVWLVESRIDCPVRRVEPNFSAKIWQEKRAVTLAACDPSLLVHSTYSYVTYRSFDGLEIPAFITTPKAGVKAAIITTFYGGDNRYDPTTQILAELGVMVLSPAVRGSWGRGKTWVNMLKGDLGGSEILDVIWGARYLESHFGLKPEQIGLHGESHGGYAALRAVTMPDNFKGQESKYPFGFAICLSGFADLLEFHRRSSIPDWLTDLLGPIEKNKDKYIDRSPITHFSELQTPLYISHGENDTRVPFSSIKTFVEALKQSTVPQIVHIQKGQGHTEPSRQDLIDGYSGELDFIKKYSQKN
jgi:protease II